MAVLSAGAIVGIAIACSVLSAVLAGAIAHWRASRRGPRNTDRPTRLVYNEMTNYLQKSMQMPCSGELVPFIVHNIEDMVGSLHFGRGTPVPAEFIATLRAAVPCDGVVGADWPLWEKMMTNTEDKNFYRHRDTALCVIIGHWLVPKMQPDGDETMTLLPSDFVSLRKRIMAKPQYNRRARAIQQFWSFITMSLQLNQKVTFWNSFDLPPPSDCRTPGVTRVREELFRLLEPHIYPSDSRRQMFNRDLDWVVAHATVLATHVLCCYHGEAEFFWVDPKTQPWPYAEERLEDDDYFLIRWPGIRAPKDSTFGDDLDSEDPEPRRRGALPPPVRDWLRLPMAEEQRPIPALMSLGGRLLKGELAK